MIKLLFAGDFIPPEKGNKIYSSSLLNVLKDKDLSIMNLEAPLTNCIKAIKKIGNNIKSEPQTVQHIKEGFFDVVCLSNNHIRDFGDKGVLDTIDICKLNKIKTVGAGLNLNEAQKALRINIKDKKISILNYSEQEFNIATNKKAGANPYNIISTYYDIKTEKSLNDYLIVIYHGGIEYQYYPTPEIVKNFKFMIDAGADCIISHHTHRYSGYIFYNNKPILFGLGNLLSPTKNKVKDEWLTGIIASISFDKNDISVEIIPTVMSTEFNSVDLCSDKTKNIIIEHINTISQTIINTEQLQKLWGIFYQNEFQRLLNTLKSNSRFEYRLRKHISFIFCKVINKYKFLNLLNMTRCPSQREKMINILEKFLFKNDN